MSGETNLVALLQNLAPELDAQNYIFATVEPDSQIAGSIEYWALIRESEGTTYILAADAAARSGIRGNAVFRRITLRVHSSLEAVGLTAAVSRELAEHRISANIVSGYYHDHIFVPANRADEALDILIRLSERRNVQ